MWVATLASAGAGVVLIGVGPPGLAAAMVLTGRAFGRLVLEPVRGDDGRGDRRLTHPQLWALALIVVVSAAVLVTLV